jgi:hypothetical protein
VAIVNPSDEEGVAKATVEKLIKKYAKLQSAWNDCIQSSFLSDGLKEKYKALIEERIRRINS